MRHRMTLVTLAIVLAYALFIQWFWGWGRIAAEWRAVGPGAVAAALSLLTATYFLRTWRIYDYFPAETKGRFGTLFRVTQVHNLLNIMLPLRSGETSFPLLMRSEFSIPLARATAALLVMRLLDLHALVAAAALGPAASSAHPLPAWSAWIVFLMLPAAGFALRRPAIALMRRLAPVRLHSILDEIVAGLPVDERAFARAWMTTLVNWLVKVLVLAWALALMGVHPLPAAFGGALGGELSSVLPVHAPGGVGTYPAGITAGALAFGAPGSGEALQALAAASISAHLLVVVSALTGTAISLPLGRRLRAA